MFFLVLFANGYIYTNCVILLTLGICPSTFFHIISMGKLGNRIILVVTYIYIYTHYNVTLNILCIFGICFSYFQVSE